MIEFRIDEYDAKTPSEKVLHLCRVGEITYLYFEDRVKDDMNGSTWSIRDHVAVDSDELLAAVEVAARVDHYSQPSETNDAERSNEG
jgi:hypothetical protein